MDEDPYYDWKLVRKVRAAWYGSDSIRIAVSSLLTPACPQVLRTLKNLRAKNDARGVLGVLETCVRTNFAGVESPRYANPHFNCITANVHSWVNRLYSEVTGIIRFLSVIMLRTSFLDILRYKGPHRRYAWRSVSVYRLWIDTVAQPTSRSKKRLCNLSVKRLN